MYRVVKVDESASGDEAGYERRRKRLGRGHFAGHCLVLHGRVLPWSLAVVNTLLSASFPPNVDGPRLIPLIQRIRPNPRPIRPDIKRFTKSSRQSNVVLGPLCARRHGTAVRVSKQFHWRSAGPRCKATAAHNSFCAVVPGIDQTEFQADTPSVR
jgi:hypothetical protein